MVRAHPVVLSAVLAGTVALLPATSGAEQSASRAGACASPTLLGTRADDVLRGTDGPDVIAGLGGDDRLLGLGGDDVLCGGDGQDVLRGGDGHDRLRGGRDAKVAEDTDYWVWYGDELAGGPGDDLLVPGADRRHEGARDTVTFLRSATGVVVDLASGTATGEGDDTIRGVVEALVGSEHDDELRGTDGADEISGVAGTDVIEGRGGADALFSEVGFYLARPPVDSGGDLLDGGAGRDEVLGAGGDDRVLGGDGRDALYGARGLDMLLGDDGDDSLFDTVQPGTGQLLDGGAGRDVLDEVFIASAELPQGDVVKDVDARLDLAVETLRASFDDGQVDVSVTGVEDAAVLTGRWTVLGTDGPNDLLGDDRRGVVLRGRGGDDVLTGSFGDDVLDGGPGHDSAWGWSGRDRYLSIEDRR